MGGLVGGVIGFVVGGPSGARWGFMLGSMAGGYLDPAQIEGPRLKDAQVQTSDEGVPRPIIYGTYAVAGNLIQRGPLIERKKTERQGKGGPETTTYRYLMSYAIRVCEGPVAGISRIWRDDKLVYDVRAGAGFDADTAAFKTKLTIYLGDEDQLPDPVLEALPAENGGGAGNVPAHRGTCYVVFEHDDLTERNGTVPQYRFEVMSAAVEADNGLPTVGAQTHSLSLTGEATSAHIRYDDNGVAWGIDPSDGVAVGISSSYGVLDGTLTAVSSGQIENIDSGPGDSRIWSRGFKPPWSISADNNFGYLKLLQGGTFVADLRPTAGTTLSWWYNEGGYFPEYGGLVWFDDTNVFIGVRKTGSSGTTRNRIYRWPLADAGGSVVAATATSPVVTAGTMFYAHMDRGGRMHAIAVTEAELVSYGAALGEDSRVSLPMSLSGLRAFAVDSLCLFLFKTGIAGGPALEVYDLATFTLQQTVAITGSVSSVNNQVICGDDSIFIRSGVHMKRIAYAPSCFLGVPDGWHALPDSPGYVTTGTQIMPLCSSVQPTLAAGLVTLAEVVEDLCERVGLGESQFALAPLTDVVTGYAVSRQMPASEALKPLQQAYFWDFPEWDLKLRAIKRGGAVIKTLGDDDFIQSDADEETRGQAVEFPRKLHLFFADPDANYARVPATAERVSENVRATGEMSIEAPLSLTRAEAFPIADKQLKIAWERMLGTMRRKLPAYAHAELTPTDCITYDSKRWIIDRIEATEGVLDVDFTRDRASAYESAATPNEIISPTPPPSSIAGPTMFAALNLPRLRSGDVGPGMYIAVTGILDGWKGADLYLSVDGGVTEQLLATILAPSTMGTLVDGITADGEPLVVRLYGDAELDSVTVDQLVARQNAAAVTTDAVSEVLQFETAEEDVDGDYELTGLIRGERYTEAAAHDAGDGFVLLDGTLTFLPLDIGLAGVPLIFRPVSRGTVPANNPTYTVVFDPQFIGAQVVEAYTDDVGNVYTDDAGHSYIYEVPDEVP